MIQAKRIINEKNTQQKNTAGKAPAKKNTGLKLSKKGTAAKRTTQKSAPAKKQQNSERQRGTQQKKNAVQSGMQGNKNTKSANNTKKPVYAKGRIPLRIIPLGGLNEIGKKTLPFMNTETICCWWIAVCRFPTRICRALTALFRISAILLKK